MPITTTNAGVESTGSAGGASPREATVPDAAPAPAVRVEKAGRLSKRRAAKLRAVWISFTGRIVAQFVGSAASILLGIVMIHNYKAPVQGPEKASLAREPAVYPGRVARMSEAGERHRPSIVVLPIDDFSPAVPGDHFAPALTEYVTAALAERDSLVVLSRTSASHIGARHGTVPAIARELGVDLVLEASVTRSADRIRVVAQLIDGQSDEHLWTGRYDRATGDILGLQAEIAGQIARGIDAAVCGSAPVPVAMASRSASAGSGADFDARARDVLAAGPPARLQQR